MQKVPPSNQAYISAFSSNSVTISGPPDTLNQFFASSESLSSSRLELPVSGPYHAPHLHQGVDLKSLLHASNPKAAHVLKTNKLTLPLMSSNSGKLFPHDLGASELFAVVIEDILKKTLRLQSIIDGCVSLVTHSSCTNCSITSFGPTSSESLIIKALNSETSAEITTQQAQTTMSDGTTPFGGAPQTSRRPKLAIVGMAGRFPDAADHEKFWNLLEAGLDVHRKVCVCLNGYISVDMLICLVKVPKDRFNVETHYDPTSKIRNTSHTPFGCFIEEPGLFDPRFFNMSPREATQTDPMHRLGLTSAYEALEMAGYVPNRTPSTRLERIGTFYGQTSDDWREINEAQDIDTYFITAGVRAFAPVGRVRSVRPFAKILTVIPGANKLLFQV